MDFEKICNRMDALIAAGRNAEVRGALTMLNEVDIAGYLDTLAPDKVLMVFRLLPKDIAVDVFAYMDTDQQARLMEALTDKEAMGLIDEMFMDDAVDILEELPAGVVRRILQNCDADKRALINRFLSYPENSAGSIMTIEYMEFHAGVTVRQAMAEIRRTGLDKETIYTLFRQLRSIWEPCLPVQEDRMFSLICDLCRKLELQSFSQGVCAGMLLMTEVNRVK